MPFLPINKEEMTNAGWDYADFVVVTGDAYVDHPTFGAAIVARLLESQGYRIAILAQPDWHSTADFMRFSRPRLGFLVTAGNIDSMVAHYTAAKRRRSDDAYSPGGKAGKRPDRAAIVYTRKIREAYGDVPVILGGLEASLRRFAHYDYWEDIVHPSILIESAADLIVYGMGESQNTAIAKRLNEGESIASITDIRGTCFAVDTSEYTPQSVRDCPSFEMVKKFKAEYAKACKIQQDEQDAVIGRPVIQRHGDKIVIQNPPAKPISQDEFDRVYALPFERFYHPVYEKEGGVPAIEEMEFSITHNRGCFGACNFCSLAFHQGRMISARSEQSILQEATSFTKNPRFKGYIHDVGGPTANFRAPSCSGQMKKGLCKGKKCLAPKACPAIEVSHTEYLGLLRKMRQIPKIKKVFIRSGIRFDYVMLDRDQSFLKEMILHHVSGQLKVAPEHCSAAVLDQMGKPHIEIYREFAKRFYEISKSGGKQQYLIPYLMSSHPGCTLKDAVDVALFIKQEDIRPEQVQDFYPTPGTISTCMYYTELDPATMQPVYVPKTAEEKAMQRALLQYFLPRNQALVCKALKIAGRADLIGHGANCLVRPESIRGGRPKAANAAKMTSSRGKKKYGAKK